MDIATADGPHYTLLHITAEKIAAQIADTGVKQKIDNIAEMFDYRLFYYPFYLFHAKGLRQRRYLHDLSKQTIFSVDAAKGYYAAADALPTAEQLDHDISDKLKDGAAILEPLLTPPEAWEKGVEGLRQSHSLSFFHAFWLDRQVKITPILCALLYKPYWRVEIHTPEGAFLRVIDATSGEVGGSNGYRFLQGYDAMIKRRENHV